MLNQSNKFDVNKLRLALVPPELIEAVGAVLTYGAKKYSENSWQTVEPERYKDALMRHLMEYLKAPHSIDDESGLPHLWHLTTNAAFLIYFNEQEETDVCQN